MKQKIKIKNPNILSGFASGFLLMLVLGWIPVAGPLLSGLISGLTTRGGTLYGMLMAFLSSLAASIIILIVVINAYNIFKSNYLLSYFLSLFNVNVTGLIILIGAIAILISTIGGYIGGVLRNPF
ncbi:MAG: hypothetical protein M1168_00920 [Candidatus Marsarchaeota archaeon]|jgi:hypothetical protein|nr:hypothetical protein [Candidatus Marsarchaeota archaeon]MCL5094531.1 hypothetical protein [Candidatus Marsarchaeota archaeon]